MNDPCMNVFLLFLSFGCNEKYGKNDHHLVVKHRFSRSENASIAIKFLPQELDTKKYKNLSFYSLFLWVNIVVLLVYVGWELDLMPKMMPERH